MEREDKEIYCRGCDEHQVKDEMDYCPECTQSLYDEWLEFAPREAIQKEKK